MERNDSPYSVTSNESQNNNPIDVPKPISKSRIRGVIHFLRKHVAIAVIGLVVVVAAVAWLVIQTNQETAWKRATDFFAHAEYEKAKKELNAVGMPTKPERLRIYGQTMLATRQLDKALVAYNKLYEAEKDPAVKLIIGNIYNEQKKYDDSIKVYREVIASNPSNIQAYVNLSTVYKLQNNTKDAVQAASDGVSKNPSSVVLHELKVSMLMNDKASAEYKAAVEALKKLNPNDQLLQALNEN